MPSPISSHRVLAVSFLVDRLGAVTNLVVAWLTGVRLLLSVPEATSAKGGAPVRGGDG